MGMVGRMERKRREIGKEGKKGREKGGAAGRRRGRRSGRRRRRRRWVCRWKEKEEMQFQFYFFIFKLEEGQLEVRTLVSTLALDFLFGSKQPFESYYKKKKMHLFAPNSQFIFGTFHIQLNNIKERVDYKGEKV